MDKIGFEEFQNVELKVGKVLVADRVEKSDKLLKLVVDFGQEQRQVISGISNDYEPEALTNKSFVFITNLEPRKILGLESQAMILAADFSGQAVLLEPNKEVDPGTKIR